jgi:hypothetical protein
VTAPSVPVALAIIAGLGWFYVARGGDWRGWVMAAPATVALLGGLGVRLLSPVRRQPTPPSRLPVVYITVPPAATPRMVAVEFAASSGCP